MYFLYCFSHPANHRPKQWYNDLPYALTPTCLITNFRYTTAALTIGWLLCVATKWRPPKAMMYFLIIFSIMQIVAPNNGTTPSHTL